MRRTVCGSLELAVEPRGEAHAGGVAGREIERRDDSPALTTVRTGRGRAPAEGAGLARGAIDCEPLRKRPSVARHADRGAYEG